MADGQKMCSCISDSMVSSTILIHCLPTKSIQHLQYCCQFIHPVIFSLVSTNAELDHMVNVLILMSESDITIASAFENKIRHLNLQITQSGINLAVQSVKMYLLACKDDLPHFR